MHHTIASSPFSDIASLGNFIYRANGGDAGDCLIAAAEFQVFDRLGVPYHVATKKNKGPLIKMIK